MQRYDFLDQDAPGIWTAPGGARIAWFSDPDGNTLSLTEFIGERPEYFRSPSRRKRAKVLRSAASATASELVHGGTRIRSAPSAPTGRRAHRPGSPPVR